MKRNGSVVGVFEDPARAVAAVNALHREGFVDVRAAAPAPFPELMDALGPSSSLGWGTFAGGMVGIAGGLALTVGTSLAWPLVTGGKEIVSLGPYVVIEFELAVLLGAIGTLVELGFQLTRARLRDPVPMDPRFSNDRIGVFVGGEKGSRAEEILRDSGAAEVRRVD